MPVVNQVYRMEATPADARRELMDELADDLARLNLRPVGKDILLAVYSRAGKKSKGGIVFTENYQEDKYQGKICLVLALGPMCCEENSRGYDTWFGGNPPKVGDWVGVSVRDGTAMLVGETTCRLVEWPFIRFVADAHDLVM